MAPHRLTRSGTDPTHAWVRRVRASTSRSTSHLLRQAQMGKGAPGIQAASARDGVRIAPQYGRSNHSSGTSVPGAVQPTAPAVGCWRRTGTPLPASAMRDGNRAGRSTCATCTTPRGEGRWSRRNRKQDPHATVRVLDVAAQRHGPRFFEARQVRRFLTKRAAGSGLRATGALRAGNPLEGIQARYRTISHRRAGMPSRRRSRPKCGVNSIPTVGHAPSTCRRGKAARKATGRESKILEQCKKPMEASGVLRRQRRVDATDSPCGARP